MSGSHPACAMVTMASRHMHWLSSEFQCSRKATFEQPKLLLPAHTFNSIGKQLAQTNFNIWSVGELGLIPGVPLSLRVDSELVPPQRHIKSKVEKSSSHHTLSAKLNQ